MSWLPDRLVPDGSTHAAVGPNVGKANLYAALYAESIQGDRQAREALFLTFNVDLGFFEQRVLGLCRGAGAAVTVVADASIYAPDVRAVHGAGTSYVVGLASMRGAFHPKLAILVGPERAVIGIGSGNVTVGGWHGNDEIFCVLRASVVDGVPAAVGALAGFLDRLPEVVDMAPSAASAAQRTSAELATLASRGRPLSTGHRLVSSLDRPLIDQLPAGRVSTLELYAPFHDPRGQALAALLARYAPDEVRIGVQPESTVIQPAALVDVAAAAGVRLIFHQLEDVPYRHGKLIQASDQVGVAWSLTGSANLSAAALLGAVGQGGNCELGLVTERGAALYPPVVRELGHHEIEPRSIGPASIEGAPPASSSASHLLEAAVEEAQVRLSLSRAARDPLVVEASAYEDLPHNYRRWAVIPADQQQVRVARPDWLTAGSRIRLGGSPGGSPHDVFLLDPALALRRVQPGSSQSNTALQPFDIFADAGQAERWMAGMYRLLASQRITQTSRPTGASTKSVNQSEIRIPAATGWRTWDDPDEWARYSENAAIRLGEPLYLLGLGGLPRLKAKADAAELRGGRPIWDDRISETDDEDFDDEHSAEEIAEIEDGPNDWSAARRKREALEKTRYRNWLSCLVSDIEEAPAIDRSARVGLLLLSTKLDLWEGATGPKGWFDLLARAAVALPGDAAPLNLVPQLASLAQVCLFRLADAAPPDGRGADGRTYASTVTALREFLRAADPTLVADNTEALNTDPRLSVTGDEVWDHAARLIVPDPVRDAILMLERTFPDIDVLNAGPTRFDLSGPFSNPSRAAADALVRLEGFPSICVVARGRDNRVAALARHQNVLLWIELRPNHNVWYRTYRLTRMRNALGIVNDNETARAARLSEPPWTVVPQSARSVLHALRLDEQEFRDWQFAGKGARQ